MTVRRQSALLASRRIQTQIASSDDETRSHTETPQPRPSSARVASKRVAPSRQSDTDAFEDDHDADHDADHAPEPLARPVKRVKTADKAAAAAAASALNTQLFSTLDSHLDPSTVTCHFPLREHKVTYHRPLLLHGDLGKRGRSALLSWYDGVNANRAMPWRKPFINPADYQDDAQLRHALTQRAYEVFISEIMLQQTRVATVIDYWNRWMDKWPTIHHLAKADQDHVMSAWRGLGYYSRCKRILEACRKIVEHAEWDGLMPHDAKELEAHIPGVGPYTAGAISSIVFGRPAPMVDGNVLRVLSRQLGLFGDTKTDKTIIHLVWAAARALVAMVAIETTVEGHGRATAEVKPNDGPGRWGQALMELGSTICTPKPDCSTCPISMTCRAYQEGTTLVGSRVPSHGPKVSGKLMDMEDMCELCEPFAVLAEEPTKTSSAKTKQPKQATLVSFFTPDSPKPPQKQAKKHDQHLLSPEELKIVTSHAQRFPVKTVKKALREQETLVCAIQRASDGMYLLQKRPEKGLLAGMWEFPSDILPDSNNSTKAARKSRARTFVTELFKSDSTGYATALTHAGELGSVPWVFSHLKLTMHVHLFKLNNSDDMAVASSALSRRWSTPQAVEAETMGTGMRQCWKLVAGSA